MSKVLNSFVSSYNQLYSVGYKLYYSGRGREKVRPKGFSSQGFDFFFGKCQVFAVITKFVQVLLKKKKNNFLVPEEVLVFLNSTLILTLMVCPFS